MLLCTHSSIRLFERRDCLLGIALSHHIGEFSLSFDEGDGTILRFEDEDGFADLYLYQRQASTLSKYRTSAYSLSVKRKSLLDMNLKAEVQLPDVSSARLNTLDPRLFILHAGE